MKIFKNLILLKEVVEYRGMSKNKLIGIFIVVLIFLLGFLWQGVYKVLDKNIVIDSITSVKLLRYEVAGIFIIFILGYIWHYLYEIFKENIIIGIVSPVNESMWEHWKMGFYPILVYSTIEYILIGQDIKNFWFSKFIGILVFEFICYYTVAISDFFIELSKTKLRLIVHIGSYFIGLVVGQISSYITASITVHNNILLYIAFIGIFIEILLMTIFTFNPPRMKYFRDVPAGEYGIYKTKH